jgi:hypothetical protein
MKLNHNTIKGQFAEISPLSARDMAQFPRHSAALSIKNGDKCTYCALFASQSKAIHYCRVYGYAIPFGF